MSADQFVRVDLARDPVVACEEILASVKEGQITGLAVVMLLRRGKFAVDVSGDALSRPTMTRGALLALDDLLRDYVHGNGSGNTTL